MQIPQKQIQDEANGCEKALCQQRRGGLWESRKWEGGGGFGGHGGLIFLQLETIKEDIKNTSPHSNTSLPHTYEGDGRHSDGGKTAAEEGEKEEAVQCSGCSVISEDLNGVKKKLEHLESYVNKIGKFVVKVMHSSATSLCLLHHDKADLEGLGSDTTKELFQFLADDWIGLMLSKHTGANN